MPFATQLAELWSRLEPRARTIVIGAAVLCLAAIVAFTRLHSAAAYAPLYSGLSAEDAGQIVEKLKEQRVPYRLSDGGKVVMVPDRQVYDMRLALAREGLPASGQLGFELFDRSGLPGTQFSNKVNFQRALQGELARTIGAMAEVAQARVHLVLPEENLFSEQTKATASVVVTPRPGTEITREMTAAIAHIVASATPGITADEVTVADNTGRLLRGPDAEGKLGGLSGTQFEIQRQYEDRLALRLQSMLDAVLGPNQSVVRVQAQFDLDSEEIKQETVSPVAGGKGLVSSEKVRSEQYSGTGGRGGVAGVAPNLGLPGAAANTPGGTYLNRDETREYQFSRNSSSVVKAPGKLKTLTLAAIIDEGLPAAAEQQVQDVLGAAAGINRDRGDRITVERMKMKTAELAEAQEKQAAAAEKAERRQRLIQSALRNGLSLAAALLIFMSVLMAVKQLRQPLAGALSEEEPTEPGQAEQTGPTPATPVATAPPVATGAAEEPELALHVSDELNQRIREQLRDMTRDDTNTVVDRLVSLMQEKSA